MSWMDAGHLDDIDALMEEVARHGRRLARERMARELARGRGPDRAGTMRRAGSLFPAITGPELAAKMAARGLDPAAAAHIGCGRCGELVSTAEMTLAQVVEVEARGEHCCCTCRDTRRVKRATGASSEPCPDCVLAVAEPFDAERHGIGAALVHATIENWKPWGAEHGPRGNEPLVRARRYVQTWPPAQPFLWFLGAPGRGKSHLEAGIVRAAAALHGAQASGRMYEVPALLNRIRATFSKRRVDGESTQDILDELAAYPLLVLDDLGAEKGSAWTEEVLYQVVNDRYARRAPLVVSTNPEISEVSERISSRLSDVEMAGGDPVVFMGPDRRALVRGAR